MKSPLTLFQPYKKFGIYHLRWQCGLALSPIMWFFIDYLHLNTFVSLILFNLIGATIFFPIDKYIFKAKPMITLTDIQSNGKTKITSNN